MTILLVTVELLPNCAGAAGGVLDPAPSHHPRLHQIHNHASALLAALAVLASPIQTIYRSARF